MTVGYLNDYNINKNNMMFDIISREFFNIHHERINDVNTHDDDDDDNDREPNIEEQDDYNIDKFEDIIGYLNLFGFIIFFISSYTFLMLHVSTQQDNLFL